MCGCAHYCLMLFHHSKRVSKKVTSASGNEFKMILKISTKVYENRPHIVPLIMQNIIVQRVPGGVCMYRYIDLKVIITRGR